MSNEILLNDRPQFETKSGREYHFIEFRKSHLHVWKNGRGTSMGDGLVPVKDVSIATLKKLVVWSKLPKTTQTELTELEEAEKIAPVLRMAHARKHKRNKYEGIPREVTCCKCGTKQSINPAYIVKRVDKLFTTVEKWCANYECRKCNPTPRGRKANPKYAHLPKELVCKCGNKVKTSATAIVGAAERRKITPEEYVEKYVCQSCHKTKGLGRGRTANPKYAHLPRELVCKCGNKVKSSPQAIIAAAERRKITPEEYVERYECQSCNKTIGRKKGYKCKKKTKKVIKKSTGRKRGRPRKS